MARATRGNNMQQADIFAGNTAGCDLNRLPYPGDGVVIGGDGKPVRIGYTRAELRHLVAYLDGRACWVKQCAIERITGLTTRKIRRMGEYSGILLSDSQLGVCLVWHATDQQAQAAIRSLENRGNAILNRAKRIRAQVNQCPF